MDEKEVLDVLNNLVSDLSYKDSKSKRAKIAELCGFLLHEGLEVYERLPEDTQEMVDEFYSLKMSGGKKVNKIFVLSIEEVQKLWDRSLHESLNK